VTQTLYHSAWVVLVDIERAAVLLQLVTSDKLACVRMTRAHASISVTAWLNTQQCVFQLKALFSSGGSAAC
jgi:hypothetical protein